MMRIDGGCHCGEVRYQADVDPQAVSICHCSDCQRLTGTAYRVSVLAARDDVTITRGEPKRYTKAGDNGKPRHQLFCPNCGSPMFTTGEGEDALEWGIRWGSIDQRAELSPRSQKWCRSAASFVYGIETLPGTAKD